MSLNQKTDTLELRTKYNDQWRLVTPVMYIPFDFVTKEKSMYMPLAFNDDEYQSYLLNLDQFLEEKITAYNDKYNKNLTYNPIMIKPKKRIADSWVKDEEAFEKHGYHILTRIPCKPSRDRVPTYKVTLQQKGYPDQDFVKSTDFLSRVNIGSRVQCIIQPSLNTYENRVTLMLKVNKMLVHKRDEVDFDTPAQGQTPESVDVIDLEL